MDIEINFVLCGTIVFLAIFALRGYQKGLVKNIITIVSMMITLVAIGLVVGIISCYRGGQYGRIIILSLLFLILMGIAYLLKVVFASAKFLSKLPVINWVNQLSGLCLGISAGVIIIWIGFVILDVFGLGPVNEYIQEAVNQSEFLKLLEENNYVVKYYEEIFKNQLTILRY